MYSTFLKVFVQKVIYLLTLAGELAATFFCIHIPYALEYHRIETLGKNSWVGWTASLVFAIVLLVVATAKFLQPLRKGIVNWDGAMLFLGSTLALVSLFMFALL